MSRLVGLIKRGGQRQQFIFEALSCYGCWHYLPDYIATILVTCLLGTACGLLLTELLESVQEAACECATSSPRPSRRRSLRYSGGLLQIPQKGLWV